MQTQRNYILNLGPVPFFIDMSAIFLPILVFLMYANASMSLKLIAFATLVFTIVMHELGHALTARARGANDVEITLTGMGGYCSYRSTVRPLDKLMISVAGPLMNGIIAFAAWLLLYYRYVLFGDFADTDGGAFVFTVLHELFVWNLILGIFNILPIYPLDGGQSMYSIFELQGWSQHRCRLWTLKGSFIGAALAAIVYTVFVGPLGMMTGVILIFILSESYRHLS